MGDPFSPAPLFPIPLFSSLIGGFDTHRPALIDEIVALKRRYPGVRRSNREDAWHSGAEFRASRSPAVVFVLRGVTAFARRCLAPYFGDWRTAELRLGHYWANVLGPGGFNAPHHHFPQHWSGVFYVSVGTPGTGPDDPSGLIEFVNPDPSQGAWGVGNSAHVPRDGMVLLFPSALAHYVHPTHGADSRISIAFNLNVVPRAADPEAGPP